MEQVTKILVALAILAALPAMALDEEDVSIDKEGRVYRIHMAFDVPARVDQIKSVLTDFTHPSRLSSAVIAREVLGQQDGVVRVRTEFRDCVLFFCKTMMLIHGVTVSANEVRADVVPEGSDFRHGFLRWSIHVIDSEASHVEFEAVMEPDFFVPPLIGGFLVRNALAKQALATAENLVSEAPRELPTTDEKQ
ncbi:MAG: hypothetical protein OEQ30_00915 [Gammaproteobacteria bacterium]|nr:hypothetical protein [Gammaproteobacteria bacterium]MDH3759193.1 hypothetical protein [Gammaproteobacteria bacterium]MDH3865373.1 hypothetical protein [Gammaproteobacteria bacterium]MDH4005051.1 hypothetical protein [Gammaproteobacteria bacterium]NCF60558.1 hypothetical protein [Gammaproteobacteria bacterium]